MQIRISLPKELVIHNLLEMRLEDMLKSVRNPMGSMPLFWCDGFAFVLNAMPLQGKAIDEYISGIFHFTDVLYTQVAEYSPVVQISHELVTNMIDMSKSPIHSAIAKILRQVVEIQKGNANANVADRN